jgi:mercuric reductase
MAEQFDLVISCFRLNGLRRPCARPSLERRAAMTEVRTLGGTCVNRGCLPSRTSSRRRKFFYDANNPRYPGLSPALMTLDFGALVEQKDEINRRLPGQEVPEHCRRFEAHQGCSAGGPC